MRSLATGIWRMDPFKVTWPSNPSLTFPDVIRGGEGEETRFVGEGRKDSGISLPWLRNASRMPDQMEELLAADTLLSLFSDSEVSFLFFDSPLGDTGWSIGDRRSLERYRSGSDELSLADFVSISDDDSKQSETFVLP
jgi:hypothetical protein